MLAGPYATMLLADMGATVVKVESPNGGDETRAWGPPWSDGVSTYFQAVNRNKRSVVCDLSDPVGRQQALELCRRADVVVENFRAGTMQTFGLGAADVLHVNRGSVYCSITGFGSGAGADLPGYDFLIQAVGGLMSVTGVAGGDPMKVGVAIVDVIAGLHALAGILAALRHKNSTGDGQHIEVNLMSSLLSALVNQVSAYLNAGIIPSAMGNKHPSIAPYEIVQAMDSPVVLAVGTNKQFAALCSVLGIEDLITDPRFQSNSSRVENRNVLVNLVNKALGSAPAKEWIDRMTARGVPCGQVKRIDEAIDLAEQLGLNPYVDLRDKEGRISRQVRHPISFSASPATYRLAPPTWDQVVPLDQLLSSLPKVGNGPIGSESG